MGQSHYQSIPLRRHRPGEQTRNTTGSYAALSDVQTRVKQPQAPTPAPRQQSYVSHAALPALPDEDQMYEYGKRHSSARRENMPTKATPTHMVTYSDAWGREVYEDEHKRVVLKRVHQPARRLKLHWLFFVGVGMVVTFALWVGGQWGINTLQAHTLDSTYGYPRYWQTDQVLGIDGDSPAHKTHLILQNLNGEVVLIVIPAGNLAKAVVYPVARLYGDDAASWPVTATFQDVNGDGRRDVVIEVDHQQIVYLNTGTGFQPQAQ